MIFARPMQLATLAVALLALNACAGGSVTNAGLASSPSSYAEESSLDAFRVVTYDYEPFRSTTEMAAAVPLVIDGVVLGVREGRTSYVAGTDTAVSTTIVLVVESVRAVQGEVPDGDGNVYIELDGSGQPLDVFARAFPRGARVVAYVGPAWDGSRTDDVDVEIPDGDAGRPAGEPLFMLAGGPQGLALQVGGYDVVWPLIGAAAEGSIDDYLPGGHLIRG